MKKIKSRNYEDVMCILVDANGAPVEEGQVVTDQFNDTWVITGGLSPQNSQSTGHVWADHSVEPYNRSFYVGMFEFQWVPEVEE